MQTSSQYFKVCRRKVQKTAYFLYSKFIKSHNSFKNWRKVKTLKLDLFYIETKSYTNFQLNITKHVREKCGKLHISYILSSKLSITPSRIDAKWQHSNLLWSILQQSHVQNITSICKSVQDKTAEICVHSIYSQFPKRHNFFQNWRKVTTLEVDL